MVHVNPPSFIFSGRPLTKEEWIKLIKERVEFLKPFFDKYPLPTLGELKILRLHYQENFYIRDKIIRSDFEELEVINNSDKKDHSSKKYSLKTRGIFFYWNDFFYPAVNDDRLIKKFWGLTRKGVFINGTLHVEHVRCSEPPLKYYNDKPTLIEIEETDIEGILRHIEEFDAYWIFHYLQKVPRDWEESLKKRLKEVKEINENLDFIWDIVYRFHKEKDMNEAARKAFGQPVKTA